MISSNTAAEASRRFTCSEGSSSAMANVLKNNPIVNASINDFVIFISNSFA